MTDITRLNELHRPNNCNNCKNFLNTHKKCLIHKYIIETPIECEQHIIR